MIKVKINSVLTDENDEKFFGNGPLYLLEGVKEKGSLSASAKAMGMSYSKANRLIRNSEEALGFKLLESVSGGKNGGSSSLSEKGEIFLKLYKEYSLSNRLYGESHLDRLLLPQSIGEVRFIILASGKGRRFEGNKLLHEVNGRPLIAYILKTLHPIREYCILSTIHEEIALLGEEMGYPVALHREEALSDSIRAGLCSIVSPCAVMFLQADQPLLCLSSVLSLMRAFEQDPEKIYKLSYGGKKASPTLFPKKYFEALKELKGEEGGSMVIRRDPEASVAEVEALFPWEIWDVDEKKDLEYIEDMITYLERNAYDLF